MKCENCGFENKNTAKFCSRCGESLEVSSPQEPVAPTKNDNSKIIVIALLLVIIILVGAIGFFVYNNSNSQAQSGTSNADSDSDDGSSQESSSSQTTPTNTKEWKLIGSYSGSGSGSQGVSVPPGQIMIKISAYPIKNYATNHLYVKGPNGEFVGVDWGSTSAVETRSDSITITTTSTETFTIEYYETVSWNVDFYRYE
jgi:hypothetical protein